MTPQPPPKPSNDETGRLKKIQGCLVGGAIGDSLGLPYEGLSRNRARKIFPYPVKQRLVLGKGLISDDTEHSLMTANALAKAGNSPVTFKRIMGWKLRWWLLGLPAGVGFATLRSCVRLWLGYSPAKSGVYSAGNGPCMRAAIIGLTHGHDLELLSELIRASTRLTHTHPKAEAGAMLVALATYASAYCEDRKNIGTLFKELVEKTAEHNPGLSAEMNLLLSPVHTYSSLPELLNALDCDNGVSGYVGHTVPVCLFIWMNAPDDYQACIETAINCGGDTDTVAAIIGNIVGARVGLNGIPHAWKQDLWEFPRTEEYMNRVALSLTLPINSKLSIQEVVFPISQLIRNILFMVVILLHGFRRLLPPY